jgi:SAM-dependent methyltransferase
MSSIEHRLDQFRLATSGPVDRLVYRQQPELLDLQPGSQGAARVIRDLERFAAVSGLSRQLTNHFLGRLPTAPDAKPVKILEICAGSGWLSRDLGKHIGRGSLRAEITTTDLSPPAGARPDVSNWQTADATELPFADKSFDLVVCAQALHHFDPPTLARVLCEAVRVGQKVSLFDLRRTGYGWIMMALIAPFYSREFIRDGMISHRRAYSLDEMRFLIGDIGVPLAARRFLPVGMLVES